MAVVLQPWQIFVAAMAGGTPSEEADEWRRRILAWHAFLWLEGNRVV